MKRNIISIDETLCNGCGACVSGCHEGALQMIDGKARIVSELYCDGLGACLGECPVDAITIENREAEPYNEFAVMERIAPKGEKVILAHLKHLQDHNENEYLSQGLEYIKSKGINVDVSSLEKPETPKEAKSELTHWPVQLHLLNPSASYFSGADVLLAADCTAYAYANFHSELLKGKKLAIACPKLDSNKEVYIEKIIQMINTSKINTLTVAIMEVPCCGGLIQLAKLAAQKATRKVPIKQIVIGVEGEIKEMINIS